MMSLTIQDVANVANQRGDIKVAAGLSDNCILVHPTPVPFVLEFRHEESCTLQRVAEGRWREMHGGLCCLRCWVDLGGPSPRPCMAAAHLGVNK